MSQLILEWAEAGRLEHRTLNDQQSTRYTGRIRLGRDPVQCDVVLSHPTVSGVHAEIFFDPARQGFYLRNLRDSNPPLVNGYRLTEGDVALTQGSQIHLGAMALKVAAIALDQSQSAPTVLMAPSPAVSPTLLMSPDQASLSVSHPSAETPTPAEPASAEPASPVYGLKCPKCHQISAYDRAEIGCSWCGTSLAAAISVLF